MSIPIPTFPSEVPICGQDCLTNSINNASAFGCGASERISCLCASPNFGYAIRDCVHANCTDSASAFNVTANYILGECSSNNSVSSSITSRTAGSQTADSIASFASATSFAAISTSYSSSVAVGVPITTLTLPVTLSALGQTSVTSLINTFYWGGPPPTATSKPPLTTGAKAGIGVGVSAGVLLLVSLIVLLWTGKLRLTPQKLGQPTDDNHMDEKGFAKPELEATEQEKDKKELLLDRAELPGEARSYEAPAAPFGAPLHEISSHELPAELPGSQSPTEQRSSEYKSG